MVKWKKSRFLSSIFSSKKGGFEKIRATKKKSAKQFRSTTASKSMAEWTRKAPSATRQKIVVAKQKAYAAYEYIRPKRSIYKEERKWR